MKNERVLGEGKWVEGNWWKMGEKLNQNVSSNYTRGFCNTEILFED